MKSYSTDGDHSLRPYLLKLSNGCRDPYLVCPQSQWRIVLSEGGRDVGSLSALLYPMHERKRKKPCCPLTSAIGFVSSAARFLLSLEQNHSVLVFSKARQVLILTHFFSIRDGLADPRRNMLNYSTHPQSPHLGSHTMSLFLTP